MPRKKIVNPFEITRLDAPPRVEQSRPRTVTRPPILYVDVPDSPPADRQSSPDFDFDVEMQDERYSEYSEEAMQEQALGYLQSIVERVFDLDQTPVNTSDPPHPSDDRDIIPIIENVAPQEAELEDDLQLDPDADPLPLDGSDFLRAQYLRSLYAREALPTARRCSNRGRDTLYMSQSKAGKEDRTQSLARCRDCFGGAVVCYECTVHDHRAQPFHRFETVVGAEAGSPAGFEHWGRRSFQEIGGFLQLGHYGKDCPSIGIPVPMSVMDVNGIHQIPILFCSCGSAPPFPQQLLETELFPASDDKLRTVFTFRLLRHYQMFNLVSKVSLHSYHSAVMYLTNSLTPLVHQSLYNTFGTVTRQWRTLRTVKRKGKKNAKDLAPGSLVVSCAACPRPGENMELPEGWEEDPLRPLKYGVHLGGDGNFHLQRRKKRIAAQIPAYVRESMIGDAGFWAKKKSLHEYITHHNALPETHRSERTTQCNTLAGDPGKFVAKKGVKLDVTDFHLGERYHYVDCAFCGSMQVFVDGKLRDFLITYDIACKYGIHFRSRVAGGYVKLFSPEDFDRLNVCCCVNKMHIKGHQESCKDNFSLNYTRGAGRTSGEHVESIWPGLNALQYSTREMTAGLREEVLTDHFNHWNWRKRVTIAARTKTLFLEARISAQSAKQRLRGIEDNLGVEKALRIREESRTRGGEQFRPDSTKVQYPTRQKALQDLMAQENRQVEQAGGLGAEVPLSVMAINLALKLESQQVSLQLLLDEQNKGPTETRQATINSASARLRQGLELHYHALRDVAPQLAVYGLEPGEPESDYILLPSTLSLPEWERFHLLDMAKMEATLWIAICHETLSHLRKALGVRSFLTRHSREFNGNNRTTRAQDTLKRAERNVKDIARSYRRCYATLTTLQDKLKIPEGSGLEPLLDNDLIMLSQWLEGAQYLPPSSLSGRQPSRTLPWIWTIGFRTTGDGTDPTQAPAEMAQFQDEMVRLEFVHALAASDRWDEEVVLLSRELLRIPESFRHEKDQWAILIMEQNGVGLLQPSDTQETHRDVIEALPDKIRGLLSYATRQYTLCQMLEAEANECRNILPVDKG